jgi:hypothetical protein
MAGVDQGEATLQSDMQAENFALLHMVGLDQGFGNPVSSTANDGRFRAFPLEFPDNSGPATAVPKAAVAKPAGTDQGEAAEQAASDGATAMVDWWEQMHLIDPTAKIDFGNIITQQTEDYEIYNAHRRTDITLASITNNATPGINTPDESPPEVVEAQSSMLDSSTTDNCGNSFVLGTMVKRDLVALTEGLPVFDSSLDFTFTGSNNLTILVAGSRLVLIPFEYESPTRETLAFLTDIIESLNGEEQRIALRKNPRQIFEVTYLLDENDRQRMQVLLMDWMENSFGFPLWHEKVVLTSAVTAGATSYPISGGDDVDFRDGGLAVVFTNANTFDVIQITTATDTTITADDPSVNAYPAGTTIMPLRTAQIIGAAAGARALNNLERFRIQFEVNDNDTGALAGSTTPGFWSTYNSRVLFDDCNVSTGEMAEEYTQRIYRIDNQTGVVSQSTNWDVNKRVQQKGFVLRSRADIKSWRQLMIALRGRQKAFYIPTFFPDLTVKASLGVGTRTMDVERIEYERFAQNRHPKKIFKVTFNNGDPALVKTIISSTGVDSTTERITFDASEPAWPSTYTTSEIDRVEFYELCRFDTDDIIVSYPRIGLAEARLPVRQVFDDN